MVTGRAQLRNSSAPCTPSEQIFASPESVEKREVNLTVDAAKSANIKKSRNKISRNDMRANGLLWNKINPTARGDHMNRNSRFFTSQICFSYLIALSSWNVITDAEFSHQ